MKWVEWHMLVISILKSLYSLWMANTLMHEIVLMRMDALKDTDNYNKSSTSLAANLKVYK